MALSVDAADAAERHCNLLCDMIPRISDALPWLPDQSRVQMSLK